MKKLVLIIGGVCLFTLGSFTNSNVWNLKSQDFKIEEVTDFCGDRIHVTGSVSFQNENKHFHINLDSIEFDLYQDFTNGDYYINN